MIVNLEQQFPTVAFCKQLSLIGLRSIAFQRALQSCSYMSSDGLHKSDLIRSHFTLFAPSETQSTQLSSGRGNWNHVSTAQLGGAGLHSSFRKFCHHQTNIRNVDCTLFLDGTGGYSACVRLFSSESDVRSCRPSFNSYDTQRLAIIRQQEHCHAVEANHC